MGMLKAGEDTGAYLLRGLHQGEESMILRNFLEGRSADCPDIDGRRQVLTFCFFRARRYEKEFESVQDVFELQRNLNNAFAYDLVPSPSVVIAALRAARRVNDFPTAVRIFEGTSCDQAILLGSWTRTARIHAETIANITIQESTPRSRTRANTPSTLRSCRASGKSWA
jgi:hypothetical protein